LKPQTARTFAVLALFPACAWLLHGLLVPVVWASLIAIATWPLHDRLRALFGRRREALSAILLTGAVVLFLLVPLGYLLYRGLRELPAVMRFWSSSQDAGLVAAALISPLAAPGSWSSPTMPWPCSSASSSSSSSTWAAMRSPCRSTPCCHATSAPRASGRGRLPFARFAAPSTAWCSSASALPS